ncbi:MAG: gluconate 2-dehydrogenase subunit 3 family protein [Bryobacteraceae bacterium]
MIERRELLKIFGAALALERQAAAQHAHGAASVVDVAGYQPRFFSDREYRVIDELTEILIPADDQSPGAHAAGVRLYIDTVLHYDSSGGQQQWRNGLAAVEATAKTQFAHGFLECTGSQKEQVVATMARNEKSPATELERFFAVLKQLTVEAFTLSDIGMKEYLGYKGGAAIAEFPGCTHPEHQRI